MKVRIPESDAAGLEAVAVPVEEFAAGLDLAVSLGGDGTMLRTVDLVYDAGVPVLGVNVGQLGYLAEVEPADLDVALARLVTGDYEVVDRMMLSVTIESAGAAAGQWWALNEAVLEKPQPGRLARLDVAINGSVRSRRTRRTASSWPRRPARPPTRSRPGGRSCRRGSAACC